mgnify:FL=1
MKFNLRPYLESDASVLSNFMSLGYGAAIGEPGIYSIETWNKFRTQFSAEKTIVIEKGLKTVEGGYVGIKNYNLPSRRAEVQMFCWSNNDDKTISDKNTLNCILDWCFLTLGLNKVTISVLDNNRILSLLEGAGFVSEGTKKNSVQVGDQMLDVTIMGLVSGARVR